MTRPAHLPPVLLGLMILLLAQMVGLVLQHLVGLPVPGVVLGLVLLVVLGLARRTRGVVRAAEPAAKPLLEHLQLLFVPPGVGIVLELQELAENALPVALAVGGSFALTVIVVGHLLQVLLRRQDRRRGGGAAGPQADGGPSESGQADGGSATTGLARGGAATGGSVASGPAVDPPPERGPATVDETGRATP